MFIGEKLHSITQNMSIADIISLAGAALGFFAAFNILAGNYAIASIFMVLSVFIDVLDGYVARLIKRKHENFGKEVDSLCDVIAFGVAPALMVLVLGSSYAIIPAVLFLFAGILRLARFNMLAHSDIYVGMPITLNGLIFPTIYFISTVTTVPNFIFDGAALLSSALMISDIKIKKVF